ncbi:MAG: aminomethyl-transferring glycine dehydrogenase [Deltaproteobacteria bacterium]|nr:aminomethyl-transferring glycine dehydrogenase [Deltaproteobacteria bacterium]
MKSLSNLVSDQSTSFVRNHVGPDDGQVQSMLSELGVSSIDELVDKTVPSGIRAKEPLNLRPAASEFAVLGELREKAKKNICSRSFIGMGYYESISIPVVQRNILENPGWYTQYTPYQAEISQGRMEALINFQTMIADLTGMELANASLLDEATAAAEAMTFCHRIKGSDTKNAFFVSTNVHRHVIDVVKTRAKPLGIDVVVGDDRKTELSQRLFGALIQYPGTHGEVRDWSGFCASLHVHNALVVVAADLLSLAILKAPGTWGADVVIGSSQRFGLPLGFGGPHAGYFATKLEYQRQVPGRIIGVSKDAAGNKAFRLALQTREQHIRREKATSNICTSQVLLAVMASMYAVYHGPEGLRSIAERIHLLTSLLAAGLRKFGLSLGESGQFFDTLQVMVQSSSQRDQIIKQGRIAKMNFRIFESDSIGVSLNETTTLSDVQEILEVLAGSKFSQEDFNRLKESASSDLDVQVRRDTPYLTNEVFNSYHSETELLRYIKRLENKDLSLTTSMIPLGSCTMKLNATSEMFPVTWPEFANLHPFAPVAQTQGSLELVAELEQMLAEVTGLAAVSLQPNAGSQGEYSGLLVIRAYHQHRGEGKRDICLIPQSAHGTNPATAALAGLEVVVVRCDSAGNVDVADLRAKAEEYRDRLACLMITYPSTHGVFEDRIIEIVEAIHDCGGQVYMDGANMNAQVGLCRPGDFGVDVCHLNLHKTFAIPHGGGGPGVGPIAVGRHLREFLPGHFASDCGGKLSIGSVSQAPYGSAGIFPISWAYIRMMGPESLRRASQVAILNANYIAHRLEKYFPVLYRGKQGFVAHECILDLRGFKRAIGIEAADVAKRLMDYGFHAPTVSFPVVETLMVEPTESESKEELDRFCDAMILIRQELKDIEDGKVDKQNNAIKNAPHTAQMLAVEEWNYPYSREQAVYPAPWLKVHKYWPAVRRVDNVYGDRHLCCVVE